MHNRHVISDAAPAPRSAGGRPIGAALCLILGPLALSVGFLVIGLFGSLAWVYLSIAAGMLAIPGAIAGVVLLVRPPRSRAGWRFNAPPGWPEPPPGWTPPPGWRPDPSWPTPPADWSWWRAD